MALDLSTDTTDCSQNRHILPFYVLSLFYSEWVEEGEMVPVGDTGALQIVEGQRCPSKYTWLSSVQGMWLSLGVSVSINTRCVGGSHKGLGTSHLTFPPSSAVFRLSNNLPQNRTALRHREIVCVDVYRKSPGPGSPWLTRVPTHWSQGEDSTQALFEILATNKCSN